MTSGKTAIYGIGGALLVACLAAANMPSGDGPAAPERQPSRAAGPEAIAAEVGSQAARLQMRMSQAPAPEQNPRNPFSFGLAPRVARPAMGMVHAAVADEPPAEPMPPIPALTLMGIAEETTPAGPRRTAVIGGAGDTLFMVAEGDAVGDRYTVKKIGADAVELEDIVTHGYRRLAMR
jgi:hypothetical protein